MGDLRDTHGSREACIARQIASKEISPQPPLHFDFEQFVQISESSNASASASLRSNNAFILASMTVQIWSKNASASASLRSAKAIIMAFNLRLTLEQKCECFCSLPSVNCRMALQI